jgi:DNA-binding transcriptional LysR family regulator
MGVTPLIEAMRRRPASLAGLDLNLLVVLRELLRERNVTRAAEGVGVTQSAASAALARLRRIFDDDLLVRSRGGYVLSPLARQLAVQIEPVCAGVERLFATGAEFTPAESEREFTLLTPDYVLVALGERLSRSMHAAAPRARLHIQVVKESLPGDVVETLRLLDGIVSAATPALRRPGIRSLELFRDRWVCVLAAENPVYADERGGLRLADLERLPWVVPHHPDGDYPVNFPLAPLMAALTVRPRVAVRVDSYLATPYFVAGTDRVAVMQRRLAEVFADRPDLRILDCPGDPPPIVETLWWHEKNDEDDAHRWFREVIAAAAGAGPGT